MTIKWFFRSLIYTAKSQLKEEELFEWLMSMLDPTLNVFELFPLRPVVGLMVIRAMTKSDAKNLQ